MLGIVGLPAATHWDAKALLSRLARHRSVHQKGLSELDCQPGLDAHEVFLSHLERINNSSCAVYSAVWPCCELVGWQPAWYARCFAFRKARSFLDGFLVSIGDVLVAIAANDVPNLKS